MAAITTTTTTATADEVYRIRVALNKQLLERIHAGITAFVGEHTGGGNQANVAWLYCLRVMYAEMVALCTADAATGEVWTRVGSVARIAATEHGMRQFMHAMVANSSGDLGGAGFSDGAVHFMANLYGALVSSGSVYQYVECFPGAVDYSVTTPQQVEAALSTLSMMLWHVGQLHSRASPLVGAAAMPAFNATTFMQHMASIPAEDIENCAGMLGQMIPFMEMMGTSQNAEAGMGMVAGLLQQFQAGENAGGGGGGDASNYSGSLGLGLQF